MQMVQRTESKCRRSGDCKEGEYVYSHRKRRLPSLTRRASERGIELIEKVGTWAATIGRLRTYG